MNLETITDDFKSWIQNVFHIEWLSILLTTLVMLIITAVVSAVVTKILRKLLHMSKNPLPSSSIFINIARVAIWVVGICVVLSTCFDVNISAAITALGVGGIAVSLGFQSTLSNLIGGLQISIGKLVEPGDRIQVGTNKGIVHDVSWRHTTIVTASGEYILIPNSVINTSALIKMPPQNDIRIGIEVNKVEGRSASDLARTIEQLVDTAVSKDTYLVSSAKVQYLGAEGSGYTGVLYFTIGADADAQKAQDDALAAIEGKATQHALPEVVTR